MLQAVAYSIGYIDGFRVMMTTTAAMIIMMMAMTKRKMGIGRRMTIVMI
jgi:hypothetical protein